MAEQQTSVSNTDYTPINMRSDNIGQATEDRRPEQVRQDRMYEAVMPSEPEHEYDSRIQSLEAQVRQKKKDREFSQLETVEERALYTLKERRAADEREADHNAAVAEWIKDVEPQLTRLKELRDEFTTSSEWKGSDVAEIDRAVVQFSTLGADLNLAVSMLSRLETKLDTFVENAEFQTEVEIQGLKNRISKLRSKRKQPATEPESILSEEDRLYLESQKEWQAADVRGEYEESRRLRSVYFAERFKRGKA